MKFKVQTGELLSAMNIVTRALVSKPIQPILDGVLFEVNETVATLTASDGSMTIRAEVNALTDEPGAAVFPGRILNDLTKRLPGNEATFTQNGNNCVIQSGRSRTTLNLMEAAAYPAQQTQDGENTIEIPQETLRAMIDRVTFALSADESRQVLTGVLVTAQNGRLELVALDGFRMAIARAETDFDGELTRIVPGRAMNELCRALSGGESACALTFGGNRMTATFGGASLSTVLLNGAFPDYGRLIPSAFQTRALVSRTALLGAIERAEIMARNGRNNLIKLTVGNERIRVQSNADTGSVDEEVDAQTEGKNIEIAFNVKYLTDILRRTDCETVNFQMNAPTKPVILTPVDNGSNETYLVLPVRVG